MSEIKLKYGSNLNLHKKAISIKREKCGKMEVVTWQKKRYCYIFLVLSFEYYIALLNKADHEK